MNLQVVVKSFDQLNISELYSMLYLRNKVFIVEQKSLYLDIDNKDQKSFHLFLYDNDNLAGYSRILPSGISYEEVSFGRVVISPDYRGKNLGKKLVEHTLEFCDNHFPGEKIRIGAQLYLLDFYNSFAFKKINEPYDEDGIIHIDMIREIKKMIN